MTTAAGSSPSPPPGVPKATELSTELVTTLLSLMPDAALAVDVHGRIVGANALAETLFGYPAGKLHGLSIEALVPERARRRHRKDRAGAAAWSAGRPMGSGLEASGRRRSGDELPVDVSLAPITTEKGTLVVAAVRDLSAQREATAAQGELAAIVQSSADAIIAMTPGGLITSWNPAAAALFGYGAHDIVGHHIGELVKQEASLELEQLLGDSARNGPHGAKDSCWQRRDGSGVDVAVSVSPLHDRGGQLRGFSLVVRDISERKTTENELRRLLAEEERLERQHAVTSEIRLVLLSGATLFETLTIICEHAADLVHAAVALVCMREGDDLLVKAVAGHARSLIGTRLEASASFAQRVLDTGHPIQLPRRNAGSRIAMPETMPDGPTLGVPIVAGGVAEAALVVVRDADGAPYTNVDLVATEGLAAQAALALELERARVEREQTMLIADRERIARDLHDHVIQQLFATGMWLQGVLPFIERGSAQERVSEAIEALDETIREIRNTIYGLVRPFTEQVSLTAQVMQVAETAEDALGMRPRLELEGPLDTAVPDDVVPHVLAVVREGLSNTARHALASSVSVTIEIRDEHLTVTVVDDGVGLKSPVRSSGLANLEERARQLGGTFELSGPPEGGTRIVWRVPLVTS